MIWFNVVKLEVMLQTVKPIDVIHVGFSKATRDYTACSPAKRLHAPNTDVLSGVAG